MIKKLVILIIAAAVLTAVVAVINWPVKTNSIPENTNSPDTETDNPSATGESRTFSSETLGVTFQYSASPDIAVSEVDKKVYVYNSQSQPESGQWLEVWDKPADQTLAQAVTERFLTGYKAEDCWATSSDYANDHGDNFEAVIITFPPTDNGVDPYWLLSEKCPASYTSTNGISYFLMDKNHPDKYLYLSIGQYAIPSSDISLPGGQEYSLDEWTPWQDTLRIM